MEDDKGTESFVDEELAREYQTLEIEHLRAQIKEQKANADVAARDNLRDKESRDATLRDRKHHILMLGSAISSELCRRAIELLETWSRDEPGCDIQVILNSPGGEVHWGYALFDELTKLRNRGHHVTTIIRGYAASMAGVLSQAGDHRVIGKHSRLMIHQPSVGLMGRADDIEVEAEYMREVKNEMIDIYMERADVTKITRKSMLTRMQRGDWWISAEDALAYGFVDEIA